MTETGSCWTDEWHDLNACVPGDLLVMRLRRPKASLPYLIVDPDGRGQNVLCEVGFGAYALVLHKHTTSHDVHVLVLCEGCVGWTSFNCVDHRLGEL